MDTNNGTTPPKTKIHDWWKNTPNRLSDPNYDSTRNMTEDERLDRILREMKRRALEAKSLGIPIPQHIQDVTGVTDDGEK